MGYVSYQDDCDDRDRRSEILGVLGSGLQPKKEFVPGFIESLNPRKIARDTYTLRPNETQEAGILRLSGLNPHQIYRGQWTQQDGMPEYFSRNFSDDLVWLKKARCRKRDKNGIQPWLVSEFRGDIMRRYLLYGKFADVKREAIRICSIDWAIKNGLEPNGEYTAPYSKNKTLLF